MSWWSRLIKRAPDATAPAAQSRPERGSGPTENDLREFVTDLVTAGFTPKAQIIEELREIALEEQIELAAGAALVDEIWAQRSAQLAHAERPGDYERLAAAFADLEQRGFLARMNFACCQNCGHAEIADEHDAGAEQASKYVFFHEQDALALSEQPPSLRLAYSYFDDHPEVDQGLYQRARDGDADAAEQACDLHQRLETSVGAEVVEVLGEHGLTVEWNGSHTSRPCVRLREWAKPLPTG